MLGDAPVAAILPCVDLEGAKKFYEDVLGLKRAELPGGAETESSGMLTYQCGQGTYLGVYQRETPTKADHTAAGWMVEDVDAVVDELIAKGVKMEVYDMPGVEFDERGVATGPEGIGMKGAWFKDPEGNILGITEMP